MKLVLFVVAGLVVIAVILVASALLLPYRPPAFPSRPRPARDYAEGLRRAAALEHYDSEPIQPACHGRLLVHGARTGRVVVLFHGITNCPQQFERLGEELFRAGDNVLIPRLPRHGFAERMTPALDRLDAAELTRFADEAVDAAAGLGDTVEVAGLSLGGVMAAWVAQNRPEVRRAVLIAPFFGLAQVHPRLAGGLARVLLRAPNMFLWWDPRYREALPGSKQAYPRYCTRALGETLRLAMSVREQARRGAPAARSIVLVQNAGDLAVSNRLARQVADDWQRHGAAIEPYVFPAAEHLDHDLIDPEHPHAQVQRVYPVLLRFLNPAAFQS